MDDNETTPENYGADVNTDAVIKVGYDQETGTFSA